jgi:hypothetical protein
MDSRNYLLDVLQNTSSQFEELTFEYCFDGAINQHIVRVTPPSVYQSDEYGKAESQIVFDFVKLFPNEGILFVDANEELQLPNSQVLIGAKSLTSNYVLSDALEMSTLPVTKEMPFAYPELLIDPRNFWLMNLESNALVTNEMLFGYPAFEKQNLLEAGENDYAQAA